MRWFRDLDSNQDTQLQRLMSYQLDDPGKALRSLAEESKGASRLVEEEFEKPNGALCAGRLFLLN